MATENQTKDESEFVKADEHIFDKRRLQPNHRYCTSKKTYPEAVDKAWASWKHSSDVNAQHHDILSIKIAHILCRIIRSFLLIQKSISETRLSFGYKEKYVDILHGEIQKVILLFDESISLLEMKDCTFSENLVQDKFWINESSRDQKHIILHLKKQLRYYLHNKEDTFLLMEIFRNNVIDCFHILKKNLPEDCKPFVGILHEVKYSLEITLRQYEHRFTFGELDRIDSQVQSIQTTLGDMLMRFYLTGRGAIAQNNWTTARSVKKNRSLSKAQSRAVAYPPGSSRRKQRQSFHEMSTVSPSPSHFLEPDELVSTLNGANEYLEQLRQDIITTMRHSVSKHEQQLPSTARETSSVQDISFSDNKLGSDNDEHSGDADEENQLNKQKYVIGTNDNGEGADQDHEGRIKFQTKMPTEHESIPHIHEPSEFFDSYNSCASLITSLTRVLDEYDSFRKTKYSIVAESRPLVGTEITRMASTPTDLELSSKDTNLRDLTISPRNVHLEEEEASAHCQSSNFMEDFQAASLRKSLLDAQKHLTVLKRTQVANQMDLQSKTTDCIDRLQTLENTLEFALKSVKVPMTEHHVSSFGLRNQELSQVDEESDACSCLDNKSSTELDRDKDDLTFQENEDGNTNSSSTHHSSSSTLVSMTLNIPLLEPGTIGPLPASVKSFSYGDSGADYRTGEDLASQNWLSKNNIVTSVNVLSTYTGDQATQTQCNQEKEPPPPILSKHWQATTSFSSAGGTLKTPNSDVSLRVPENAINPGEYVDIHAAVSTDLEFARQLIAMSPDEHIVSPIAEYWAGENFRFDKPVCIIIPHFLPANTDLKMVRVYRVSKRTDGRMFVTRIRHVATVNITEPAATRTDFRQDDDAHQDLKTEGDLLNNKSNYGDAILPERRTDEDHFEWDDGASFFLSSDGKFYISTIHFSFYMCTDCGCKRDRPTMSMMACGLRERHKNGQQTVDIAILVGDKRLRIADFQLMYANGRHPLANRTFPLPSTCLKDSHICMRLRIAGSDKDLWRHCLVNDDEIGCPEEQYLPLDGLVRCDKCPQKNTEPQIIEWMLESLEAQDPDIFKCVVDTCHVAADSIPAWSKKNTQTMSLQVKESIQPVWNADLAKLLSQLSIEDLKEVARKLKIPEGQIELLDQKCNDERDYKDKLSQLCIDKTDCSKVLNSVLSKQISDQNYFPNVVIQSSKRSAKRSNSVPQLLHIENSSNESSDEELASQPQQVNSTATANQTPTLNACPKEFYPLRYQGPSHNHPMYAPVGDAEKILVAGGIRNEFNPLIYNSTEVLSTSANNESYSSFACNHNFFNNNLVSGVDRLPAVPILNNTLSDMTNPLLNNMRSYGTQQVVITAQRQLCTFNLAPEDPEQLERALSEIRFDDHDQFPTLSSHSTQPLSEN